ncbi:NOT2 family protein [Histoplasma ohiense]|nr:NOT2 family protein [Histoplasma ohiense (nom. inval.)]
MNRPGPGQQQLRGMSGFPTQQQPQTRTTNPSLASTRLPNGTGANWGFGLPMGGAPGLQSSQLRTVNTMNSFAQGISGSQPATPLDLSEFPSLSSVPQQSQSSASGQATWANASQRVNQQSAIQRQSQTPTTQPPSRVSQTQPQSQSHASHEDLFPSAAQFAAQLDDFRNGGQGISGQLSSTQPQTGNIDEFPPLGRNAPADIGQERRASLLQSGAFGNYGGGMAFPNLNQSHSGQARTLPGNMVNGQQDSRIISPGAGGSGVISASRSPMGQVQNGGLSQEKEDLGTSSTQRSIRPEAYSDQQSQAVIQPPPQSRQPKSSSFGADGQEQSLQGQSSEQSPLSQMPDRDRFGLQGLLTLIHNENPDVAALAVGQDLMTLGLDLNHPEPLHPSFASPFISSNSAVPLQVDYTLPACYNVANVQPLQTRIPSFSDETLFYIFYSMPRDIMQELVAEELMGRKWRYHKVERAWLTRDDAYPSPVEVERGLSERGFYLWWDPSSWKKVRREFILRYADLDNHLERRGFVQGVTFPQNV